MFEKPEDYGPYIEAGLNPSAAYAAPQSFNNGKGVTIEQGIVLLRLKFVRCTTVNDPHQAWWVGPLLHAMPGAQWKDAPWPSRNDPRVVAAVGKA
jgi:hypothetical protein